MAGAVAAHEVADALRDAPGDSDAVAARLTSVTPRQARLQLQALAELAVVDRDGEHWRLTERGRALLER